MQICVVGMGYVGQVVGFCLSETGQSVICVDVQEHVLEKLRCGQPTLHEPGLEGSLG
ncbi:MAG: hypothetical protein WBC59_07300 [Phycisphaerae bacterium]